MDFEKKTLDDILEHTKGNENDILHSKKCSCLFCRQTYGARMVSDWSNEGNKISAVCPECGMTAVVGDASGYSFNHDELKKLNETFFGLDFMEKHPESIQAYVERYREGKITHKAVNNDLYLHYLTLEAEKGNPDASFYLGEYYEFGSEFDAPNLYEAALWYSSPSLYFDGEAIARVGVIKKHLCNYDGAFEEFARSMALGSMPGLLHFSDAYMDGTGVMKDRVFAMKLLINAFGETQTRFTVSEGREAANFASLCYRLGKACEKGYGVQQDDQHAIRMYLCAQFAYSILKEDNRLHGELISESRSTNQRLRRLAKLNELVKGEPVFDADTFIQSLNPYNEKMGRFDLIIPNALHNACYTKDDRIFTFRTESPYPILVVDFSNLYAGFIDEGVNWFFENVEEVSGFQEGSFYNRVFVSDDCKKISFYNTYNAESSGPVGEIYFADAEENEESDEDESGKA